MREEAELKSLLWVSSSKRDLMDMPKDVRTDFGHGLYQAQLGEHPDTAKTLSGFGGASVIELIQDHKGALTETVKAPRLHRLSSSTRRSTRPIFP